MASAGQAQAHSSQPMHFSSPSGCRLRTCRPWKRGGTGRTYSGYSSVVLVLNIVVKVTPKPFTGSRKLATVGLLCRGRQLQRARRRGDDQVHRRQREAALLQRDRRVLGLDLLRRLRLLLRPQGEDHDEDRQPEGDVGEPLAAAAHLV